MNAERGTMNCFYFCVQHSSFLFFTLVLPEAMVLPLEQVAVEALPLVPAVAEVLLRELAVAEAHLALRAAEGRYLEQITLPGCC